MATTAMPTVIVYRALLLPSSETFIKAQIQACRRWRAVLVGRRRTHQLPLDGLDVIALEPDAPGRMMRGILKLRRAFGKVPDISRLAFERPQLLHAHFGMDAVEAFPIARALDVPMVVTLHGFDINIHREWWESGNGGVFMRGYPRRLLRLSQHQDVTFIAVSDAIKQQAVAYGIPEAKIQVMYIGVDLSAFNRGPVPITVRCRKVLFVGRLVEKKGCEYLLRAMRIVSEHVLGCEITVVGEGPQRPTMEALATRLGINATFTGVLSSDEVKQQLDTARVFCLPSVTADNGDAEGLGIVLLEAQAKGVPVVTSSRGGMDEGIDPGETGFAFAERDINALSEALMRVLADDRLAERMAAAGPAFIAKRFDILDCTARLETFYEETVAKRAARCAARA